MDDLIAASMSQPTSANFRVRDTVFVKSISPTTTFTITMSTVDTHLKTIVYHLKLQKDADGVSVIAREDLLSLAKTREEIDEEAGKGDSSPQETRDRRRIDCCVDPKDVRARDIIELIDAPSRESLLSGLPEKISYRIFEVESVKMTRRGPSFVFHLPGGMLGTFSPPRHTGILLLRKHSAREGEEDDEVRYALYVARSLAGMSIENYNNVRSDILAASRLLEVMHGRHGERVLSEPLIRRLQKLGISRRGNDGPISGYRLRRADIDKAPPATAVSSKVSKSKLVGPGTTSEMRFAMANEAQKAGKTRVNNPVAIGKQIRLTTDPAQLQQLSDTPVDELEIGQEFGPADLVEVTTGTGAKYKGRLNRRMLAPDEKVVEGYLVIGNVIGDTCIWRPDQIRLLRKAKSEEARAMLAQNQRQMTDESFNSDVLYADIFKKQREERRKEEAYCKQKAAAEDAQRKQEEAAGAERKKYLEETKKECMRECATLRKTGTSSDKLKDTDYEVGYPVTPTHEHDD